ncbi:MAG: hypothetical protein HC888_13105 [Candidatus Competibacteraceae bacterium]|nr:hypothetical protein [Candidatus Competibacteraceae bacterium]
MNQSASTEAAELTIVLVGEEPGRYSVDLRLWLAGEALHLTSTQRGVASFNLPYLQSLQERPDDYGRHWGRVCLHPAWCRKAWPSRGGLHSAALCRCGYSCGLGNLPTTCTACTGNGCATRLTTRRCPLSSVSPPTHRRLLRLSRANQHPWKERHPLPQSRASG